MHLPSPKVAIRTDRWPVEPSTHSARHQYGLLQTLDEPESTDVTEMSQELAALRLSKAPVLDSIGNVPLKNTPTDQREAKAGAPRNTSEQVQHYVHEEPISMMDTYMRRMQVFQKWVSEKPLRNATARLYKYS
uniref:Uncharacterized protein n=1 Tax=Timema poppense TaxID=170557 RepID=A0A7R9H9W9_TIMPO|nr:unnamed protein product [Timema poppensis]